MIQLLIYGVLIVFLAEMFINEHLFHGANYSEVVSSISTLVGGSEILEFAESNQIDVPEYFLQFMPLFSFDSWETIKGKVSHHDGYDLIRKMVCVDFKKRLTAKQCLLHPFLADIY